jgi:hypothetical protein
MDAKVDQYFQRMPDAKALFTQLMKACAALGDASYEVQSSGIALGAPRHYAYAWLPVRAVRDRPAVYLVVTLRLNRRIDSPRFVEIVEPYPDRYAHHLILSTAKQLDPEFLGWLKEARTLSLSR